ncbi:hypothetical protein [Shewanella sp. 10N.286.48.B5]|uniref:hypothetical protein n=1 Tax=Shewanella sp. 10N.286.48.B5 TaxID=1880834 RepID=UPI0039A5F95B
MLRKRSQIRDYKAEARLFTSRAFVAFIGIMIMMTMLIVNLYNVSGQPISELKLDRMTTE